MEKYSITKNKVLARSATSSAQGRNFLTGGRFVDALKHLALHPNDVCLVRDGEGGKLLLGSPIPDQTALDVTWEDFSHTNDAFDVGEMTRLVQEWFLKGFNTTVTVRILESGELTVVGHNSKLISLSRQTPGLLDMAATENGLVIGQYNTRSVLGHSGDMHSNIGGVNCLHHELGISPTNQNNIKMYFIVGYNSLPLKAWRDSRVFWIVHDPDVNECWLVPHNLSRESVGDTTSASMALVSKFNEDGRINVLHLSTPVQASLSCASPLRVDNREHGRFLNNCMDVAKSIDWSIKQKLQNNSLQETTPGHHPDPSFKDPGMEAPIDRTIAVFDGCDDALFWNYPTQQILGTCCSLSGMYGPLKVLARGCCANSRVVAIDGSQVFASSDVNLVSTQLSGVILVKTNNPDIYKLQQIRWNTARGPRTVVIAITPQGFKYICGPLPPSIQIEDYPTPVAGIDVSEDKVNELLEFALSGDSDTYYGALYQPIPCYNEVENSINSFISNATTKNFRVIIDEKEVLTEESFNDIDFRQLLDAINLLSISNTTAIERNHLAIRIVKFLKKMAKQTAEETIANDEGIAKSITEMKLLQLWQGDNVDWAVTNKEILEELLKESNVTIAPEAGVVDLALQTKLTTAIEKKTKALQIYIATKKNIVQNSCKNAFNRVLNPALETLMRSIGDNPRYLNFFPEIKTPNMTGIVIRATQSTNKQSVLSNPEDVMRIFHRLGATGFTSFSVNFFQKWKSKVINELCVVDQPGCGFNDRESLIPASHRIEDGPADPAAAYEIDIRHQFVLPVFPRLPKQIEIDEDDEDDLDDDLLREMPLFLSPDNLSEYLLLRKEFMLRDPEQGPKHPLWLYCDWLFSRIKIFHGIVEKEAAPLAIRALAFSIFHTIQKNPNPDQKTLEVIASIIHAINFMSARGDPQPHGIIDTFFNMGATYVPQTKEMEQNPWQIEVVNILSRAVDYLCPILSLEEYAQVRSNFQRGAANVVKRQIVQKILDHQQEARKKNALHPMEYVAKVNNEFYPAYKEIVETIGMLIEADPGTFLLTDDLIQRINVLHHTVAVEWAEKMRRCRVGPVREMVNALKTFSQKGHEAMTYLVSRKPYLTQLYDQVFHIKYESCDHAMIEELCKIIRAKARNPENEKHSSWLARVERALQDIACYDTQMSGWAHGNKYKPLPTELMREMLQSLQNNPISNGAVKFAQIQLLLSHIHIRVDTVSDLYVSSNSDKPSVFSQLRGEWWMCPDNNTAETTTVSTVTMVPAVPLIALQEEEVSPTANIAAVLGDTYHHFELARLFTNDLASLRGFVQDHYKFHLEWFEDTILAAGLPGGRTYPHHEREALYGVVQRLVCALVEDGADRGDRARDIVYGPVLALPHSSDVVIAEVNRPL